MTSNRKSKKAKSKPILPKKQEGRISKAVVKNERKSKPTARPSSNKASKESSTDESNVSIRTIFPSRILNEHEIVLEKKCFYQESLLDTMEFHFNGTYKGVPVLCICVPNYDKQRQMLFHEFRMSARLSACRNMGVYFSIFESTLSNLNVTIDNVLPNQSVLVIVRQHYVNQSLKKYIEKGRRAGDSIEPMHVVQMAMNIFSMLSDAHSLETYLVDITKRNIYVDVDGSLYFCGFRSCLGPGVTFSRKKWISLEELPLPEKDGTGEVVYSKCSDIFSACYLLLYVMYDKSKSCKKLIKIDRRNKTVDIQESSIDKRHKLVFKAIKQGFKFDPEKRPAASKILESLENIRRQSNR